MKRKRKLRSPRHGASTSRYGIVYISHIYGRNPLAQYLRNKTTDRLKSIIDHPEKTITDADKDWIRSKTYDPDPGVQRFARLVFDMRFPHEEEKVGLEILSFEFFIRGTVRNERDILFGIPVNIRFFVDDAGLVRYINYDGAKGRREGEVNVGAQTAAQLLSAAVHELNAPFWDKDELDAEMLLLRSTRHPSDRKRKPAVYLRMLLNRGGEKVIEFYNSIPDPAQDLLERLVFLVGGGGYTTWNVANGELPIQKAQ